MPDIPPEAIQAAATAIERELMSGKDYSMAQDSDEALARAALEAASPLLADACAAAILAHMNRPVRRRKRRAWRAYRRHFSTAARVAAGTFDTREDQLRMAAGAIAAGNLIACNPLPPLASAYPPGAVPLDTSRVPGSDPQEHGYRAPDGTEWIHVPWSGWERQPARSPFLREDDGRGR